MFALTAPAANHKRRINDLIFESLRGREQTGPTGFYCECESQRCFAIVRLTAAEFQPDNPASRPAVLAPGHRT